MCSATRRSAASTKGLGGLWAYFGYTAGPKMLELVIAVSKHRRLPDGVLDEEWAKEAAELLEVGIRAMLVACTGAMTCYKLERLRTLRRRRARASEEETAKPRRVGRPPKNKTAAAMMNDLP